MRVVGCRRLLLPPSWPAARRAAPHVVEEPKVASVVPCIPGLSYRAPGARAPEWGAGSDPLPSPLGRGAATWRRSPVTGERALSVAPLLSRPFLVPPFFGKKLTSCGGQCPRRSLLNLRQDVLVSLAGIAQLITFFGAANSASNSAFTICTHTRNHSASTTSPSWPRKHICCTH